MSLRAMNSAHEPVVLLAGMVQEKPATLSGMDLAEICITMQEICIHKHKKYLQTVLVKYARDMHKICCQKYA